MIRANVLGRQLSGTEHTRILVEAYHAMSTPGGARGQQ